MCNVLILDFRYYFLYFYRLLYLWLANTVCEDYINTSVCILRGLYSSVCGETGHEEKISYRVRGNESAETTKVFSAH